MKVTHITFPDRKDFLLQLTRLLDPSSFTPRILSWGMQRNILFLQPIENTSSPSPYLAYIYAGNRRGTIK